MVKKCRYVTTIILVMLTFSNCIAQKKENVQNNTNKNVTNIDTVNRQKTNYGEIEGVSLTLPRTIDTNYSVLVTATPEDSSDCNCPIWSSKAITGMRFFGIFMTDSPNDPCDDYTPLNGNGCNFFFKTGKALAISKESYSYEAYQNLRGSFDTTKYYIQCEYISIPDTNDNLKPYDGENPIYEIDSTFSLFEITMFLNKECSHGTLKNKNQLFDKNGLSIRIAIDASKSFPVAKQVK